MAAIYNEAIRTEQYKKKEIAYYRCVGLQNLKTVQLKAFLEYTKRYKNI